MEKIKLFVKKNEEKKDDRKLIEKIEDWIIDDDNLPLLAYGIGIGVGLGCGYLLGKTFQYSKDNKEFKAFLKYVDDDYQGYWHRCTDGKEAGRRSVKCDRGDHKPA